MSFLLFIPSIYIASRRALVAYDCFFFFFSFPVRYPMSIGTVRSLVHLGSVDRRMIYGMVGCI